MPGLSDSSAPPPPAGRAAQLRVITAAIAAAQAGHGGGLVIVGEGGIGKSHLAAAAQARAHAEGMRVLRGRARAIGREVAYRPLREALMAFARHANPSHYATLGPYLAVLGRLIPDWAPYAGTADADSLVLAEALLRLLHELGRGRGCLLVLDDLQYADADTMAVLDYLVDNVGDQHVLLIGAMRPEPGVAYDVVTAAAQRRTGVRIDLDPLDRDGIGGLTRAALPGDGVPEEVIELVWASSLGNPSIAEQVLRAMTRSGAIARTGGRWRLDGTAHPLPPDSVMRAVTGQAAGLGPAAHRLLTVGSVIGRRFPAPVVRFMLSLDEPSAYALLRSAGDAGLVAVDEADHDWYAFTHPLAAEALLADVVPGERADLARRAAEAISALYPEQPGDWCHLAARLHLDAGNRHAAGRLYATAGRRALAAGAAGSAVAMLERAYEALAGSPGTDRAAALEDLIGALAGAGQVERALGHAAALNEPDTGLGPARRVSLHLKLAEAAGVAGRHTDGLAQIAAARSALGAQVSEADGARLDLVAAQLAYATPTRRRGAFARAERLARHAAAVAERLVLPEVACQAWLLVGCLIRQRNVGASTAVLTRMNALAEAHNLPVWQLRALIRIGGNEALQHGSMHRLDEARRLAHRMGAVTSGYEAEANIAMQTVLLGDFATAPALIDAVYTPSTRLRLTETAQYMLVTRAAHAAHQGLRADMDRALSELRRWDGDLSVHTPLALGLVRAFCSLLEEDRPRAAAEIGRAVQWEDEHSTIFQLTGRYGLLPLLQVMAGDSTAYAEAARAVPARQRWNRHFILLADAVRLGRQGRAADACTAAAKARQAGEPFRLAYHLGLRLAAEEALAYGWGEPTVWLREAEGYFADLNVLPVASACRALLRQAGVPVRQRRNGVERIPGELRAMGLTVREYEVFQLLVTRPANRVIAGRLHISPRTVEKHIASLLAKTKSASRMALSEFAAETLL